MVRELPNIVKKKKLGFAQVGRRGSSWTKSLNLVERTKYDAPPDVEFNHKLWNISNFGWKRLQFATVQGSRPWYPPWQSR
jgi:hypothetical protein